RARTRRSPAGARPAPAPRRDRSPSTKPATAPGARSRGAVPRLGDRGVDPLPLGRLREVLRPTFGVLTPEPVHGLDRLPLPVLVEQASHHFVGADTVRLRDLHDAIPRLRDRKSTRLNSSHL